MKSSVLAVVAAVLLAVPASAYAQDKDTDTSTQQPRTSQNSRSRSYDSANYESSLAGTAGSSLPLLPRGSAGGPLPNVFRNCEHPRPRFCYYY
jgi:hypothetical protein